MKNKNSFLGLCLVLSILFHIYILMFVPTLSRPALPDTRYTEVVLIPVRSSLQIPQDVPQEPPIEHALLWTKGLELNLKGTLERTRKPSIHLPETFPLPPFETAIDLKELTEKEEKFFTQDVFEKLIGSEESRLLKKIEIKAQTHEELLREKPWEIKGPASERKVVFRPPSPFLQLKTIVEIELKFWVLPDGSIGRIIPIRRADPILEGEMMAYLKKWRFNPLPSYVPQEEQWGTIPIKYLLK